MKDVLTNSILFSGMLGMNRNLHMRSVEPSSYQVLSDTDLETLHKLGAACRDLALLTIQVPEFFSVISAMGEEEAFQFLERLMDTVREDFTNYFQEDQLLHVCAAGLGEFVLILEAKDKSDSDLMEAYLNYRMKMLESTGGILEDVTGRPQSLFIGFSKVPPQDEDGFTKRIFRAFCNAQRASRQKPDTGRVRLHREFLDILSERKVRLLYQPVMDFTSGAVLGWEAFSRGPEGSVFHDPMAMFAFATELGELYKLERMCRELSIRQVGDMASDQKLFLNVSAPCLNDPAFSPINLAELVGECGFKPENVVFEFTERQTQSELATMLRRLEFYRQEGFLIAVDDVGAGNSSLRSLSQIRPDYIKSDISLTGGISSNPFKRVMVETLVLLSEKIGSIVIAEGVETEAEFTSLVSMGVQAGQGYYFARAASPKPTPQLFVPATTSLQTASVEEWKCSTPVRDLVEDAATATPDTVVEDIKKMLDEEMPLGSVVVVEDGIPVGLLMSYNLDRHLGTQYGISLYYRREVTRLMDRSPLTVEVDQAVEDVAKLAMNRESQKIYDDIIVVNSGLFQGTVSVQKILDTLAQVQVKLAKGSNPLTGLPGNVSIEQEINQRALDKLPSSLIYFDIDNFKVYNDLYGFNNGDRGIILLSRVLKEAVRKAGNGSDFIGHVGGDDFVIISEQQCAETICDTASELFSRDVPELYNAKDQDSGYVVAMGRDGKMARFPLMTVSMGIIDCQFETSFTLDEMSQRVAEVKKYAKTKDGSAWVRDRRAPLGSAE